MTERKLHSVDMGVAYSTDLGVNVNAGWHDRNLFGNAEQLNLTGAVIWAAVPSPILATGFRHNSSSLTF